MIRAAEVEPLAPASAESVYLTDGETIQLLRLDVDGRDPHERLRNLVRRQGLPEIRKGRLRLFKRAAVEKWLESGR